MLYPITAALAALVLFRPVLGLYRLARLPRAARRHWPAAMWAAFRWRWLARNAGLAYIDHHHRRRLRPRVPFTTAVRVQPVPQHLERWPKARFRVDEYGWSAHVRTVPKVGREELAKAAPWIADAWACHRVQVTQARPGRVTVRALRADPLAQPLPMSAAPAAAFAAATPTRLYLGRDMWGAERWVPLANLPALLVGGLPGYGKSVFITSILAQLLPSRAVNLAALCDLKDGGDYLPWEPLAERVTGDRLADVADALSDVNAEMRRRLAELGPALGVRNGWKAGPSPEWPLQLTIVDEAHTGLDLDGYKGDREAEAHVRAIRRFCGELTRKGRSAMMLTVLATQKTTGDSVPTAVRDNMPLAVSFAVKTRDAAVACLGDSIRDHPDKCPTMLQGDEFRGCMTAGLRTGLDPYTVLRSPEVTEDEATAAAAAILTARTPVPAVVPLRPVPAPLEVPA